MNANVICLGYDSDPSPRVRCGLDLLKDALRECGYTVHEKTELWGWDRYRNIEGMKIYAGHRGESAFLRQLEERDVLLYHTEAPRTEGFYAASLPGELLAVSGGDDSGVLYGCQELARRIRTAGELPKDVAFGDAPRFRLRGPAIGLQKTTVEPPRQTYEYPITPDRFPWFYDRKLWTEFLDMLLEERCNVIYLWSGHPFSSLVKLDDYPEALEVTMDEFARNADTFRWLTEEAGRRGIWVVLKFYNIHIPLPFAEKHGLKLHQPKPLPITSDYYKKSLAAFVKAYPNAGLMVCLGEALQGQMYGAEWFTGTILEGIREGLRESGAKELPPVIVRSHAIDANKVVEAALPLYPNLYTEAKYNGESLTTWTPRGKWQHIHRQLASHRSVHIINVHILANLEPFRYGSPAFIQKCMQAAKYRLHANGLHLYPLFFWDWPYSPDRAEPRLTQMDRDWIWFAAWFRYAWNPDRDPDAERRYWTETIGRRFGSSRAGAAILEAYDAFGECAPKLLRRFGITEGNRQTMSLGMTMSQLTNPDRHMPWPDLWESHSPQGERLEEYVAKELSGEPHVGETPPETIADAERHAEAAAAAIEAARAYVVSDREAFERLADDVEAIRRMVYFYSHKVRAALAVLTYKRLPKETCFDHAELLGEALSHLEKSVQHYRELTVLTKRTYDYANSMQTPQRKVPVRDGFAYRHWSECLPIYEQELERFRQHVGELTSGIVPEPLRREERRIAAYREAPFALHSSDAETYVLGKGAFAFTDGDTRITGCAEELEGVTGIRFSQQTAAAVGCTVDIELPQPANVLIGYFNAKDEQWLQPPSLEENTHADDRGGYMPILRKGLRLFAYPSVNVHAIRYEAGRHTLDFGKGAYLVLGVIRHDEPLQPRDVEHRNDGVDTLDWLFE